MKINVKSDCRGMTGGQVVDQVLSDRGIEDKEAFLNPVIKDMLPLEDLENIENAAQIVLSYVEAKKKIGVFGDVDLDGITSAAIIYRYLKKLDSDADLVTFINPTKNHGLQKNDLEKYKICDLLIIVDSLDPTAFNYEEVQRDSNVSDVIVLDHHTINPKVLYDRWITLVTSQRNYGNTELSGAGVCMKFVLYLDKLLGTDYAEDLYDLSASGIVGDLMDMSVPENRYIVSRGLERINNPAIAKLAGGGFGWNSRSISFSLGPVVNASVRLGKNEYALKAFLSDDEKVINENIKILKKCKDEQNLEIDSIMSDIEKQCMDQINKKMMVVYIKTDHGISGVVGNKIVFKYNRPIIIISNEESDYYSGSMRAVGVDNFQRIINESGLGEAFGHENASGIKIKKSNMNKFIDYMEKVLPEVGEFEETMDADIWANVKDITRDYISFIEKIDRISGNGFKPVRVYLDGITDYEIKNMSKGKHLVIDIGDCGLNLVQWNFNGDWEELDDASMFGYELEAVVELQANYIGRKFMLMGIIQWLHIKE